jgi:hypothetical protein
MRSAAIVATVAILTAAPPAAGRLLAQADSNYLLWTPAQAEQIGLAMRKAAQAGPYRVQATWLTPEVVRATARILQLREGLNVETTDDMVQQAEAAADTAVLIELSGPEAAQVTAGEIEASFTPAGAAGGGPIPGTQAPGLEEVRAYRGVAPLSKESRAFWLAFKLPREAYVPVIPGSGRAVTLTLRVKGAAASVSWPIPDSLRAH